MSRMLIVAAGHLNLAARVLAAGLLLTVASAADEPDADWSDARELAPGVLHEVSELREPRPMRIHCLRIDSETPHLNLFTTPRRADWHEGRSETNRETVRNFIRRSRNTEHPLVAAVNADAFSPWPAPYDREDPTDLLGLAVSEGVVVSSPAGTPSFIVDSSGRMRIETLSSDADLTDIDLAVSGFALCLDQGHVLESGTDLHPRTAVGLSQDRRYLYMLTIDGRQPDSQGATVREVGQLLKDYGADTGINMDGGGSTTMAWWNPQASGEDKCELLNVPVGRGQQAEKSEPALPFSAERANGNNLGVYFAAGDNE